MKRDRKKYSDYAACFLGGMASVFDIGGIVTEPLGSPGTSRNNTRPSIKSYFDATCTYLKNAQDRLINEAKELKK